MYIHVFYFLLGSQAVLLSRQPVIAFTPNSATSGTTTTPPKKNGKQPPRLLKTPNEIGNPNSRFQPLGFVGNIVEQIRNRKTMKDRDTTLLRQSSETVTQWSPELEETLRFCQLAELIYHEPSEEFLRPHEQTLVETGRTANVRWMVTDSTNSKDNNELVSSRGRTRTITIRGFDARDESVDREGLWQMVCCSAQPKSISLSSGNQEPVLVHTGLYEIAQTMYETKLKPLLLEATTGCNNDDPTRIIICGHSIGGALSTLLLLLITLDQGLDFVQRHIYKVYTFGAPPVAGSFDSNNPNQDGSSLCPVLQAFGLPSDLVHGYIQPWDPVARLGTKQDPLYQLVVGNEDFASNDATTLSAGQPFRLLCWLSSFVLPRISWWPEYRDGILLNSSHQSYIGVGYQHIFVPEQESIWGGSKGIVLHRFSESNKFYPALAQTFPMEASDMAHLLPAIRSFSSHESSVYSKSLQTLVYKMKEQKQQELLQ